MEKRGIVGPYDGRNPRKILLSEDEYFNNFEKQ
jgi:S-DNA-T family DNA segregation ATPase FtsK/SpoIIIE